MESVAALGPLSCRRQPRAVKDVMCTGMYGISSKKAGFRRTRGNFLGSKTYHVSLVCGIISNMAEKMLPVGAITRDNMKVSITLADKHDATTESSID